MAGRLHIVGTTGLSNTDYAKLMRVMRGDPAPVVRVVSPEAQRWLDDMRQWAKDVVEGRR